MPKTDGEMHFKSNMAYMFTLTHFGTVAGCVSFQTLKKKNISQAIQKKVGLHVGLEV